MRLPDGPRGPALLQKIEYIFRPVEFLEARRERYGDAFTLFDGNRPPVVYLSHPQAIKEIFTADPKKFDSGRGNRVFAEPLMGENSLGVLDGEAHQRQRRLLMPPFHGERMRAYGQVICDITQQVIEKWTIGKAFPVRSFMQEITLRSILSTVFGLHQGDRYDRLQELVSSFVDSVDSSLTASLLFLPALRVDLGWWSPWGRFVRLRSQIDELLYREIQERQEQMDSDRTDILSLLLMAREAGHAMTDTELRDQLMTLLFTGHETTATALAWALYWIHHVPEVESKLRAEFDTISPDASPMELTQLPYLTAVCQETLRIYPVTVDPSVRIVNSPLQITGYEFEPGTVLTPCIYLTHHREDLYPDAKRFQPERFLDRQFSPYEYIPFGGGSRSCIGMAFAMLEMKLVLATILRQKQLALADCRPVKPVRRGPALAPSGDLQMVCTALR